MPLTSVFRLVRHFGRRCPAGTAQSEILGRRSSFPKRSHPARLYSESRPNSSGLLALGSIGRKIGDVIFGRTAERVVDVLRAYFPTRPLYFAHPFFKSPLGYCCCRTRPYITRCTPRTGAVLSILSRWRHCHEGRTIDQFISLFLITSLNLRPEALQTAMLLRALCVVCEAAVMPILSSAREDVATVLSMLPESGVEFEEKLEVVREVALITHNALRVLLPIFNHPVNQRKMEEFQKMVQREPAKTVSGDSSYSLVG